ncbi:MAG: SRPBCC family protein [Pseudomonadota bacterium]
MKKLLIILCALVAVILIAAAIAPKDFIIERSVVIHKPRLEVFDYLKMMENGKNWQPWSKKDPNMDEEITGVDGTPGAVQSWSGNSEVGVGQQEILKMTKGERIDFELRFQKPMHVTNQAYFITETVDGNSTRVVWGMMGRTPYPLNLACLMMHGKVEKDFTAGLEKLKMILETETVKSEETGDQPAVKE